MTWGFQRNFLCNFQCSQDAVCWNVLPKHSCLSTPASAGCMVQIRHFLNLQWSLVEKGAMDLSHSFIGECFIERVLTYFSTSRTIFSGGMKLYLIGV